MRSETDDGKFNYISIITNEITEPIKKLCCAVVFGAMVDCKIDPEAFKTPTRKRQEAVKKKEAIDFIESEYLDIWVTAGEININPIYIRELLKEELQKRPKLVELIESTKKKYYRKNMGHSAQFLLDPSSKRSIIP